MFLYFILNKVSGKYYIGKTTGTIESRWRAHKYYASKIQDYRSTGNYFYRAIRKYGADKFEVRELFRCSDVLTLNEAEKYFIKLFESSNSSYGYNCTLGGDGGIRNEETRRKVSLSMKGKNTGPLSMEHRKRISEGLKGRIQSQETRQKISSARKGIVFSEESRKKMSLAKLGKPSNNRK